MEKFQSIFHVCEANSILSSSMSWKWTLWSTLMLFTENCTNEILEILCESQAMICVDLHTFDIIIAEQENFLLLWNDIGWLIILWTWRISNELTRLPFHLMDIAVQTETVFIKHLADFFQQTVSQSHWSSSFS